MTGLLLAGLLLQAPATQEPAPPAAQDTAQPPALQEIDALRVENYLLRLQALQAELDKRREVIDARIRAAYPGWRMDWTTGQLVPATPPAPEAR